MNENNNNGRDLQEISRKMGLEVGPEVGPMTWYEAQEHCSDGWRLPTREEFMTWRNAGYYSNNFFWTECVDEDGCPWYFFFDCDGGTNNAYKASEFYVRAVRELPKSKVVFNYKLIGLAYTMVIGPCQGGFGRFFKDKDHEWFEDEEQLVTYADSSKVVLSAEDCHVVIFPSEVEENMFGTIVQDNAHVEIHTKWATTTFKGYGLEVANLVVHHLRRMMDETELEIFETRCETSRQEYHRWLEQETGHKPE